MYMPLTGQKLQEDQPLLSRTPRRLKAHPFQLDCPNSTQSLSNVVDLTFYQHKKFRKHTIHNSLNLKRRKRQDRIFITEDTKEKTNSRKRPDAFWLEEKCFSLKPLEINIFTTLTKKTESWCFSAEMKLNVFWLRHNLFFLKSNYHIFVWSPHQNSLQCLSLSRKRNQEPVDISHFKRFHLVLAFSHFHVLTFQYFSPSTPANLIIYCDPLASSRAQLYNQTNLCRLKSCSTKHTCSTLAVINKLF